MLEKTKICPYSNEEFIAKRSNQIYACKEYRVESNNIKQRALRKTTEYTDKMLHKNYKILNSLLNNDESNSFSLDYLKGAGFDFKYFTSAKSDNKSTYYCIYDIAFKKTDDSNIIIKRV